jgi:HSP20 family protein
MSVWDPFSELDRIRRELERTSQELGVRPGGARPAFLPGRAACQYPVVNVYDDAENIYVEALAPGIDPNQMEITFDRNTLTIAGEKIGVAAVAPERVHRNERAAGRFVRTVQLTADVDPDKITADYKHGLLALTLPRAEAAKPRRIQLQAQ